MLQVGKRQSLALFTALMTMFALLVFPTGAAFAVDRTPIDCLTPTLQAEITAASPGDTIIIIDGSTCTGNFTVGKALTIRAATAAGATLDGGGVDGAPVLNVTASGDLTLQDLTITGGLNSAGDGGGIRTTGSLDLLAQPSRPTAPPTVQVSGTTTPSPSPIHSSRTTPPASAAVASTTSPGAPSRSRTPRSVATRPSTRPAPSTTAQATPAARSSSSGA